MTSTTQDAAISGKTMRWTWTAGPTQGKTHEHTFNKDGTVEYREIGEGGKPGKTVKEKVYSAIKLTDDIHLVSYQSTSGYTLTVAVNFADNSLTGFASGAKDWYPVKGEFAPA